MASLLVLNKAGLPVIAADVRVMIPGDILSGPFDKSYLTGEDGVAEIGVSVMYATQVAHVVVTGQVQGQLMYAAFDWPVYWTGLEPSAKTVKLVSANEPESTFDITIWLRNYYGIVLATGVAAALVAWSYGKFRGA
jgi:hypothetical protein